MKTLLLFLTSLFTFNITFARIAHINSPDDKLKLELYLNHSKLFYSVTYNNKIILEKSPLGLITNEDDFANNLSLINTQTDNINRSEERRVGKEWPRPCRSRWVPE